MKMNDRYIDVDGISIRYVCKGEGHELLLLHGFGEFLETWFFNVDFLSHYYKVYAMDLPGHGLSQKPKAGYTMDFAVNFVVRFMEALGIERTSLMGHSVCGSLCLDLAIRFSEKVDSLVLVGSTCLGRREAALVYRLMTLMRRFVTQPTRAGILAGAAKTFYDPGIVSEGLVNQAYHYLTIPKTRDAMLNVVRSNVSPNGIKPELILADRFHLLRSPTLIVHGAEDRVIPVAYARSAWSLIPGAKLEVFGECGHFPHMERAEAFNQAVIAFLEG